MEEKVLFFFSCFVVCMMMNSKDLFDLLSLLLVLVLLTTVCFQ